MCPPTTSSEGNPPITSQPGGVVAAAHIAEPLLDTDTPAAVLPGLKPNTKLAQTMPKLVGQVFSSPEVLSVPGSHPGIQTRTRLVASGLTGAGPPAVGCAPNTEGSDDGLKNLLQGWDRSMLQHIHGLIGGVLMNSKPATTPPPDGGSGSPGADGPIDLTARVDEPGVSPRGANPVAVGEVRDEPSPHDHNEPEPLSLDAAAEVLEEPAPSPQPCEGNGLVPSVDAELEAQEPQENEVEIVSDSTADSGTDCPPKETLHRLSSVMHSRNPNAAF